MVRPTTENASGMDLTPREKDKLLLFTAALLAERRRGACLRMRRTSQSVA